jgi:hypothetical protein
VDKNRARRRLKRKVAHKSRTKEILKRLLARACLLTVITYEGLQNQTTMNNHFSALKAKSHRWSRSVFGRMSIAALVILALLGGLTSLVLLKKSGAFAAAVLNPDHGGVNAQGPHRVPKGQLQADLRTAVAAFRWLTDMGPIEPLGGSNGSTSPGQTLFATPFQRPLLFPNRVTDPLALVTSSNQPAPSQGFGTNQASRS